ncbi:MAG: DMT family transporter [Hoeflea sp.]|uniref:DMT family transporter n=1 Tax=Hoeflea sp. TaxID=1940281 RepID=UPI002731CF33|nr:DMT family transporter [Hoeflea sp.]MDP2120437.1 DMT family transporter [Hoeflea sp.]MDP3523345.1 DMT family transporter [Hoeflea sp.]MDZ7601107.1 DMT family transporter [Hoeflea sp.]
MPHTHRPGLAALWMIGSILSFSTMAVAGRYVSGVHSTFEIMTFRSLAGLLIVLFVAGAYGRLREIRTERLKLHFFRNLFHFTGQNLWFFALATIPLAQVFALEFTTPVWVIVLGLLFLGERLTLYRVVAAALGFAGILIVARPDFGALEPGLMTAAASAIFFAATIIMTKSLTRHESIVSILFWLTLIQLGFGGLSLMLQGPLMMPGPVTWPTLATFPWLLVVGVTGLLAHYCLTTALSLAPASFVMPIDFTRLPLIAVVGMVLFGESADLLILIGGGVIILANWINISGESRARSRQEQAALRP